MGDHMDDTGHENKDSCLVWALCLLPCNWFACKQHVLCNEQRILKVWIETSHKYEHVYRKQFKANFISDWLNVKGWTQAIIMAMRLSRNSGEWTKYVRRMSQVSGEEEIWVQGISKRHVASASMVITTIVKPRKVTMVVQPVASHLTLPKVLPGFGTSSRHQFHWCGVITPTMQRHLSIYCP